MAKHIAHYGIRDAYKFYKDTHGNNYGVETSVFSAICKEFNQAIAEAIIFKAFDFKLPFRLGRLRIRKYKPKVRQNEDGTLDKSRLRPDWHATKLLREKDPSAGIVYHLNEHSNGYQHRWFWEKRTSNIPNHSAYFFGPCRNNKRGLAAALKNENIEVDYFE